MKPDKEESPDEQKGSYSATIGMVIGLVCLVALILHDRRTVDAVVDSQQTVTVATKLFAEFATTEPEDAVLVRFMKDMEAVVAARGGADCSPMFDLLGRQDTLRGARTNVATALALRARSEVLKGDLDAAAKAAKRYEEETKDDLVPSEVDAWVWRITELVDYPGYPSWTQLFDLQEDPLELDDRAHDEGQAELLSGLRARLEELERELGPAPSGHR